MSLGWSLAAVPLLISLNAFFVVSEYAVVAIRPAQLGALRERGRARAASAMEALLKEPAGAIGAIQVCITMTNLLLGWIGEPAMSQLLQLIFAPAIALAPTVLAPVSVLISFVIVTLLTVVFSELLPKAMTLRAVETAATVTAVPILAIRHAIGPLVWLMNKMANLVSVPLGFGQVEALERQVVTTDDLKLMAIQAAEEGVVTPRERSLVLNSLSVGRRPAREIMIPRVRVVCLDLNASMADNGRIVEERLFSRMPLCDGGLDRVVGVVRIKEFLEAYYAGGETSVLTALAEKPVFMPETTSLDRLIGAFADHRTQMVFLVDEYGGVEGILTLHDVINEFFHQR